VDGLVVIGGEGSLKGAVALHRQGVPIVAIPASIDNDIPGTDISLGVDTALNNIIHAVDCIRDTANSSNRAFVVETMGRNCGYLALAAGVASGAEHVLIPEMPEIDIEPIAANLSRRYREGRLNAIILVAEGLTTAQNIADRLKQHTELEVRIMVLGHYQRGGSPSVFDRLLGSRFGVAAVTALRQGTSGKMTALVDHRIELTDLEQVVRSQRPPLEKHLQRLSEVLSI
jgi:6-phosphofructokinase 1